MQDDCKKVELVTPRIITQDMKRLIRSFKRKDGVIVVDSNYFKKEQTTE